VSILPRVNRAIGLIEPVGYLLLLSPACGATIRQHPGVDRQWTLTDICAARSVKMDRRSSRDNDNARR